MVRWFIAGLVLAPISVAAQPTEPAPRRAAPDWDARIEACRATENPLERLRCWDSFAQDLASDIAAAEAAVAAETPTLPPAETPEEIRARIRRELAGTWTITRERSPVDDRESVFIVRYAIEEGRRWQPDGLIPTIHFRCLNNRFEGFVATGSVGGYYGTQIRLRFGQSAPLSQRWANSSNYNSVFMPDARAFVRVALQHESLIFEATTDRYGAQVATFHLNGLREAIEPVLAACRVSLDPPRAATPPRAVAPQAPPPPVTVQLGVYPDRPAAAAGMKRTQDLYGGIFANAPLSIQIDGGGSSLVYRLVATARGAEAARQLCATARTAGLQCDVR